jgi:ribosome-associated toxin RatA of RatAB toxin-antitoxin module
LLGKALGPVFHHIANTFVDSFVRRAERIHPNG